MKKTLNISAKALLLAIVMIAVSCCETGKPAVQVDHSKTRKVLLLYSAGHNSLWEYVLEDISDLKQGWLPGEGEDEDVLLVYTHTPLKSDSYKTPSSPYLIRLYHNQQGEVVSDTLLTYEKGTVSSSAPQLNKVLNHVKDHYPAKSYGMIFSSHATGFLPAGYYSNPSSYTFVKAGTMSVGDAENLVPVPYIEPEYDPSLPMVKSIGQDVAGSDSYEIDLRHFAEAIPMKLDYILFDACFMGGIEVAYELREKCGKVGFSQAEVLADGLPYKTLAKHLLKNEEPDLKTVCKNYFIQYDLLSGVYRSATISLIDCDKIGTLADVCRGIFAANREGLAKIDPGKVQRFFRFSKHWFYDLESIIIEAGATETELAALYSALDECVLYKGHTPEFIGDFEINVFSGFSMYLPCDGGAELDKYYRTLKWNEATELVEY